jgi:hypothetical protein
MTNSCSGVDCTPSTTVPLPVDQDNSPRQVCISGLAADVDPIIPFNSSLTPPSLRPTCPMDSPTLDCNLAVFMTPLGQTSHLKDINLSILKPISLGPQNQAIGDITCIPTITTLSAFFELKPIE